MPSKIKQYLNNRGISDSVISEHGLSFNEHRQISIPIRNQFGRVIFYKYRKDPDDTNPDNPKYKYQKGSVSTLFNAHKIKNNKTVYIVEGELDALRLESEGLCAVSSTGGSGTFKEEWASIFKDVEVFICYDNDDAGIKGALNVHKFLPNAKIKWLPDFKGKDITDYVNTFGIDNFLSLPSESYIIPNDYEETFKSKKEITNLIKEYKNLSNIYLEKQKVLKNEKRNWRFTEIAIEILLKRINSLERQLLYFKTEKNNQEYITEVDQAKKVPIGQFISVQSPDSMIRCLWHDDRQPSMKYYHTTNHLYCFGGCGRKDVIDVVQKINNVSFQEALKIINGKH